jgi:tetratricopeptide (TPR) repeat protein
MAAQAGIRPEDVILQIDEHTIKTIDGFAALSTALRGRVPTVRVVLLRNGQPREVALHIYSYPLLREWELTFVPDYELRFIDPSAGRSYWANLGRGFEEAGQADQALTAYLNALHHVPADAELAMKAANLYALIAHRHLDAGRIPEALGALGQQTTLLTHLFDRPLDAAQLQAVKAQLQQTLEGIRQARASSANHP